MSSKEFPQHHQQQQQAIIQMIQELQENIHQQNEDLLNIQQQNEHILQMNIELRRENEQLRAENAELRNKTKSESGCCCTQLYRYMFPKNVVGNRINDGDEQVSDQYFINQLNQR